MAQALRLRFRGAAGDLVEDHDHILLVGASTLATEPRVKDSVTVQDRTYLVKAVDIVRPAGTPLLYRLTVNG